MKSLLISFSIILLIISCDDNNSNDQPATESLFPIAVGNKWIYTTYSHDSNGDVITDPGYTQTDSNYISIKNIIDDVSYYLFDESRIAYPLSFVINNNIISIVEYDVRFGPISNDPFTELVTFKYPVKAGDEWTNSDSFAHKVIAVDSSITTPAGIFECILYEVDREETNTLFYYFVAPSIGIIRTEIKDSGILIDSSDLNFYTFLNT